MLDIDKKTVIVILVALIIVSSASFYIWYMDYRNWSIDELHSKAKTDDKDRFQGFESNLAGEEVTIEGKVTSIDKLNTNQGNLTIIQLDDYKKLSLVKEGSFDHEVGEEITMDIKFKKGKVNGKDHVFSKHTPPDIQALSIQEVNRATNNMSGLKLSQTPTDSEKFKITFEDSFNDSENDSFPVELNKTSCRLYSGTKNIADDYNTLGKEDDTGDDLKNELLVDYGELSEEKEKEGITFYDTNDNGIFDGGDYFTVSGLEKPDEELSLNTYHFVIDVEGSQNQPPAWVSYMVFNEDGLLRLSSS